MNLRKAINDNCKDCLYDKLEPGTWLQQVTLCVVKSCALHNVRPKTTHPIPESVLSYYGVKLGEYQDLVAAYEG
jgi:hypothetical protein